MNSLHNIACHIGAWQTGSWEPALEECAETGFNGIEFSLDHFTLLQDQTEDLQERFKQSQMKLSAVEYRADVVYPDRKETIIMNALHCLSFLQTMKSNLMVIHTGQRDILQDKKLDFTTAAETVNDLGHVCLDHDCNLCVMTQTGSRIWDEEDIDRLLNMVDTSAVFLGIDTAHLQQAGLKPEHIISTYGECVKHVRFQDTYPQGEEPDEGIRCAPLGEGCISFRPVIRALDALQYDGWLTITLETPNGEPAEPLEESFNNLQNWIKSRDEPEPKDPFAYGGLTFG